MTTRKYAVCNEMFGDMGFSETCAVLSRCGYQGIEIAPFTIATDPKDIGSKLTRHLQQSMADNGLEFVGLHWLLASPEGLHIASPDQAVRRRSLDHMRRLLELAGELGGGVLILGSPKQRNAVGLSTTDAVSYLEELLLNLAATAQENNSSILLEALASGDTNVINTLEEARTLIRKVDRPSISGMFDFHNCGDEAEPWPELIERHFDVIRHIHLNETNGSYPGTGASDFLPAFRGIFRGNYAHWVSLEIFHVPEDPEAVVRETMSFLEKMEGAARE